MVFHKSRTEIHVTESSSVAAKSIRKSLNMKKKKIEQKHSILEKLGIYGFFLRKDPLGNTNRDLPSSLQSQPWPCSIGTILVQFCFQTGMHKVELS